MALGPRPAGSPASRALAERLRRSLPNGRFQAVPGGLRNVIGSVRGRDPKRFVVVGAHYDTKDIPGFVGANDGAAGTAVVTQLAHGIKPRRLRPTVVFILFDGEEAPAGAPEAEFAALRAARQQGRRRALPEGGGIDPARLRRRSETCASAARPIPIPRSGGACARQRARAGVGRVFPAGTAPGILDDHTPFTRRGVPSIDLIDFDLRLLPQGLRRPLPDLAPQPGCDR